MDTKNQTSSETRMAMIPLANIQPSPFNPRKNFSDSSLAELTESIRQQGVLQPIRVRPIAENRFEIVFGERRYRASIMAGLKEISATINNLSDEEAEEMAITENLQRKDVTPIEEANAYQRLIESGHHDIKSLASLFGKSESYINTRLKFVALIPEIAELLEKDELSISAASEICRYSGDIQKDIYEKHLKDALMYNSWRGLKAADIAKYIEKEYTTELSRYSFDKTFCLSCPHNTNNIMLFCDGGCGNCANRTCLAEMNASYLTQKAVKLMEQYPGVSLCHQEYNYNETVVERLAAMGHEIVAIKTYTTTYPETPEAPVKEEHETTEEYNEAYNLYEQELSKYTEQCKSILERKESGEITLYFRIEQKEIVLCYFVNNSVNGNGSTDKLLSPMEKLEKQDKRNKEIALEKTVEDTKKQILEVNMSETKFGADEEKMMYYFLLKYLRRENYKSVGLEDDIYYLTDDHKKAIAANLTGKIKSIIRRDFLISEFQNAYGNNSTAELLLDFARKHMPERLADIENAYNEVYEKRHKRIEEKKAILSASENSKEAKQNEKKESQKEVAA